MTENNHNQIPDWLARWYKQNPNGKALFADGKWSSWGELYVESLSIAENLHRAGVVAGARVALLMGNNRRFAEMVHAVSMAGAILVPLNLRLTVAELAWQVQDVGASLLVTDKTNREKAQGIAHETGIKLFEAETLGGCLLPVSLNHAEQLELGAVHSIVYSSGTTGKPKGVKLTYGNHFWNALASSLNLGLRQDDRWLAVLPLFHVGGLSILLRSAIYGIPAIVHNSFDPAAVNRAIDQQGVTIISVVANMLQRMLDERGDKPYPSSLRCVLVGGGPVPQPLLERCARLGIPVTQTYGLTETASQVATLSPADALRKLGSAGRALYPSELKILKDEVEAKAGEVGEIVVRGPIVTAGYFNRAEATTKALRGGWLHTGDLGKLDEDGYLYVVDRRDDLIISGGENVYPAELEAVLLAHPAVEEAGVVAQPHERWGQVPVAAVKLRAEASVTEAELLEWCTARLARYKIPAKIYFRETLPRNAAGKLVRRILKEEL